MSHKKLSVEEELSYRRPLQVKEIFVMDNGDGFPICPKCKISFDGQYQMYCSYCGQHLGWRRYSLAKIVRSAPGA